MPGDQCLDGAAMRDLVSPQAGDLVISEWMANPNKAADMTGEWFEVLVNRDVDLNGLVLGTNTAPNGTTLSSTSCLRVTAGSYLVFARSDLSGPNGGLPHTDFLFSFDLVNSSRGIALSRGGVMLDTVTYTTTGDGVSTQVVPDKLNPTDNDLTENHCPPRMADTYGLGDRGTPGMANTCM
jgi:hypothetical protein